MSSTINEIDIEDAFRLLENTLIPLFRFLFVKRMHLGSFSKKTMAFLYVSLRFG